MQNVKLIGYHTSWKSVALDLRDKKINFRPGDKACDWLGTGVYFWIDNLHMAYLWGLKLNRDREQQSQAEINPKEKDIPVIIQCSIDTGTCLNLADTGQVKILKKFMLTMERAGVSFDAVNQVAPPGHYLEGESIYRYLDHRILDAFDLSLGSEIDTVFGVFNNGKPIYPGSSIFYHSNIQIAVRLRAIGNLSIKKITDLSGVEC